MNRRELIKSIVPAAMIPTLTVNGITKAAAVLVPKGYYMLFVDVVSVDVDGLAATSLPDVAQDIVMDVIPVKLRSGQSIQDAIALYKVTDGKEGL